MGIILKLLLMNYHYTFGIVHSLKPLKSSFLLASNTEIQNWSRCSEEEIVKVSYLNEIL